MSNADKKTADTMRTDNPSAYLRPLGQTKLSKHYKNTTGRISAETTVK